MDRKIRVHESENLPTHRVRAQSHTDSPSVSFDETQTADCQSPMQVAASAGKRVAGLMRVH